MTRPPVSVVVPFAGDVAEALVAVALLRSLTLRPGDERILADNSATAPVADDLIVIRASGEHSPAHARNAGAARASGAWILFLDADTRAPAELLDSYFADPVPGDVGALVGEIEPAPGARTLAGRYGASRNFLGQRAHLAHPYRPRAAAANLCVRRSAFDAAGGFREGLRAAEDTDFCWRLQDLGWRLELRPQASVLHTYRATVRDLRRQWRAYAAGRAWLAREYPGFHPEPALRRVLRRRPARGALSAPPALSGPPAAGQALQSAGHSGRGEQPGGRADRLCFLALDAVLAVEELVGFRLSNRAEPRR